MDISNPENPFQIARTFVDYSIETLFPTEDYMFIGGDDGMYIFDRSDPENPEKKGEFQHVRSYDPVVVQDTVAYVTLRDVNSLMAISIKDPANPWLISEKSPFTPYGLTVRDSLLYVSNGNAGYSLYNVSDPGNITQMTSWSNVVTKDFIWSGDLLFVMGFEDLMIFNVTDPQNPALLSTIQ